MKSLKISTSNNNIDLSTSDNKIDLIILSIIDCIRIDWHNIYIDKNTSGYVIYKYFEKHYNKHLDIDFDSNGRKHKLKRVDKIENYILDNPFRMCVYIYF
tara:strand:+ start:4438 stop:4737 length:300 start_codon:yes stop_codon:yes gene_type:complete